MKGAIYYGKAENVSSKPILGITLPLWMGIGGLILGFFLMLISRPYFKEYLLAQARNGASGDPRSPAGGRPAAGQLLTAA